MGLVYHSPHIHHSDQGIQYAAYAYIDLLNAHQIFISMVAMGKAEENITPVEFESTWQSSHGESGTP
jgi:hypothetical protein